MITEKDVLAALANVRGPDGKPVTGALSGVTVNAGKVYVSVSADPQRPQAAEPVRQAVEAAVKAIPGVAGVIATLTAERPAGSGPGPAAPGPRAQAATSKAGVPGVKHIIAVAS
ncbi:iron-sulfur cluster assembly protein, partial [Alsobacter sp. R-9]